MNPQPFRVALAIGFVAVVAFLIFMLATEGCGGLPPEPPYTETVSVLRDASR